MPHTTHHDSALRRFSIINPLAAAWGQSDWFTPLAGRFGYWVRSDSVTYHSNELVPCRVFTPSDLFSKPAYTLLCSVRLAILAGYRRATQTDCAMTVRPCLAVVASWVDHTAWATRRGQYAGD